MIFDTQVRTYETPQRKQAEAIRASHERRMAELKDNRDLTPDAKKRQIIEATRTARAQFAALQADEKKGIAVRKSQLESSLYGLKTQSDASSIIAMRDASDRAARLESGADAVKAMQIAHRNDDHVLIRAIAATSAENGWHDATSEYVTMFPKHADTLDELGKIHDITSSPAALLGGAFMYGLPAPSGISEFEIAHASTA